MQDGCQMLVLFSMNVLLQYLPDGPRKKTHEANKTDALWPPSTFMENGYFCWKGFILVYSLSRIQTF